jgi:hypothetical protein
MHADHALCAHAVSPDPAVPSPWMRSPIPTAAGRLDHHHLRRHVGLSNRGCPPPLTREDPVVARTRVIQRELVTDPTGEPRAVITYTSRPSLSWFAPLVRSCRVALVPFRDTPHYQTWEGLGSECRDQDLRCLGSLTASDC